MTENKRFDVVYEEDDEYKNIKYWEIIDKKCGATTSNELKICHLLNNLNDENEQLKDALNQRTDQCDNYYKENEQLKDALNQRTDQCDKYYKENEQLKQRNNRQAKRLAELYELMAKKDWDSLTEIIDDFCSCEEQLQRESGTYGEWDD